MEIKDKEGNVIDRVLSLTKEGKDALKELGYDDEWDEPSVGYRHLTKEMKQKRKND